MSKRRKVGPRRRTHYPEEGLNLRDCWHLFARHTSTVEPGESIRTALRIIAHKGFRHLPVINWEREVVGVASAQDLINALSRQVENSSFSEQPEELLNTGVSRIMSDNPITVKRDQTILDAIELMSKNNIGALPIVSESTDASRSPTKRGLVGIITLRDIVSMMATFSPFGIVVKDYMTHDVMTIEENDTVSLAIGSMSKRGIRRLPVLDSKRSERIDGMLTNKMILRLFESCLSYNGAVVGIRTACKQLVKSIMITPMPIIDPNEDCGTASYLMRELGTGGFAVADSRGLLGIITERDIVRRVYKREGISFFSDLFLSKAQTLYS